MTVVSNEHQGVQIPKIHTHVPGLDDVLHGGLPRNRTTLIKGSAGSGKTVLGLELLYHAARAGEPALFVCFEETAGILRQNARAMGWDLESLEKAGKLFIWEARIDHPTVISGDFSIDSLLAVMQGKAEAMGARLIMIDAIDVLMRIFEDPIRERNELYRLHDWLLRRQFTAVLTVKEANHSQYTRPYDFLEYMADCVLFLDMRVAEQVTTRRLRVVKYRGSGFCSNEYPYIISPTGSVIMPITGVELSHRPSDKKVTSGCIELDTLLGGGYQQGTCILISGPTGTGKTTLAATFTQQACRQGDRVLYISFEESQEAIITAMRSPGIDLQSAVDSDRLRFYTVMPEALVPEEHLYRILGRIERFDPTHLIIDAVSACQRMATSKMAYDFMVRLIDMCKQRTITCLMTNQSESNEQLMDISGIGISSIVDTLITLRYRDLGGRIVRDLVIVKSRATRHSDRHHLYTIGDAGIAVGPMDVKKE